MRYVSAEDVFRLLPPADAVAAIENALRDGLDPAAGVPRSTVSTRHGSLLLMPAESPGHAGVKLVTVAPGNAGHGLPTINGVYVLFDAATLRPAAIIDGTALTTLRTPAVSFAAVRRFLPAAPNVVVFGAGPQGAGHLATLEALTTPASVTVVTRSGGLSARDRKPVAAARDGETTSPVRAGGTVISLPAGSQEVDAALRGAELVVCATTAREPLFDSRLLSERAIVVAVGAHEPDAREVDAAFCARATVIVEDAVTALREAGDVVQAVAEGALDPRRLLGMGDAIRGAAMPPGPILFKGTGMSWQDLVVAEALIART